MKKDTRTKKKIDKTPIITLVNSILTKAIDNGSTIIRIVPTPKRLAVFEKKPSGKFVKTSSHALLLRTAIISRIKIMTGSMNIADKEVVMTGEINRQGFPVMQVIVVPGVSNLGDEIVINIKY